MVNGFPDAKWMSGCFVHKRGRTLVQQHSDLNWMHPGTTFEDGLPYPGVQINGLVGWEF